MPLRFTAAPPNSELVAVAWIASIDGFSTDMVATTLPPDDTKWAATGFVTVAVVGGNPHPDLPVVMPVIQADCWATKPGSNKPPWFMAAALASAIRYACWQRTAIPRQLDVIVNGAAYPTASVRSAYVTTEPRRIYDDAGDYARFSMDIALNWAMTNDRIN